MKSYTVSLTSAASNGIPQVLDHYFFFDPLSGSNFIYPLTADGGPPIDNFHTVNYTVTADDQNFAPWGYLIQDKVTDINIGLLKGPYTINFDPSGINQTGTTTLKIIYNFGDGTPDVTINSEIIPQFTFGQAESATSANATIVSHAYYPQSNTDITVFTPSITAYSSNIVKDIFNITLSIAPASIYDFNDIHLISNTQQLSSTETQNIFEIEAPDYLTVARVISGVDVKYPTVIPFDPNNINGTLITWLDASDAITISRNSNNQVLVWNDKSVYQNNYYCNDITTAPVFLYPRTSESGRKCVHFTTGKYLYALSDGWYNGTGTTFDAISANQGWTIAAIVKFNSLGTQDTLFSYDLNTNEALANDNGDGVNYIPNLDVSLNNSNSITVEQGDTSYYFSTSASDANNGIYQPTSTGTISQNLNNYSLYTITVSGSNNATVYITTDTATIRRMGQNYQYGLFSFLSGGTYTPLTPGDKYPIPPHPSTKIIPASSYDPALVYALLGTSNAYVNSYLSDAEISEFMLFNTPLDTNTLASVQTYLINKWGLTLQTD